MENPEVFEKEFDKLTKDSLDWADNAPADNAPTGSVFIDMFSSEGHEYHNSEYRKKWLFKNGYGVSVVRGYGTYGADEGLFEVAIMEGDNIKEAHITYDTEFTDDVIGNLKAKEVLELGIKVSEL